MAEGGAAGHIQGMSIRNPFEADPEITAALKQQEIFRSMTSVAVGYARFWQSLVEQGLPHEAATMLTGFWMQAITGKLPSTPEPSP